MGTIPLLIGMSTAMSALGSVAQAQQSKRTSDFQSKQAEQKAREAEQKARDAINRGIADEQKQRMDNNQRISRARADAGASGVDVGSGSVLDHFGDMALLGEQQAASVRDNAIRNSNDSLINATDYMNKATLIGMEGDFNSANSLLKGSLHVTDGLHSYARL